MSSPAVPQTKHVARPPAAISQRLDRVLDSTRREIAQERIAGAQRQKPEDRSALRLRFGKKAVHDFIMPCRLRRPPENCDGPSHTRRAQARSPRRLSWSAPLRVRFPLAARDRAPSEQACRSARLPQPDSRCAKANSVAASVLPKITEAPPLRGRRPCESAPQAPFASLSAKP